MFCEQLRWGLCVGIFLEGRHSLVLQEDQLVHEQCEERGLRARHILGNFGCLPIFLEDRLGRGIFAGTPGR